MKEVKERQTQLSKTEILKDFFTAMESRENSLMGRKEVFMGKAKFGIFGDGKELAQIAMAKVFRNGDFRSGYYRDQTFMMAIDELSSQQFFAQLYAHTNVKEEPASGGRMMNGHFGTRSLNEKGQWKTLTDKKNSASDISPTAAQMPRLVGLAYASKLYRQNPGLNDFKDFSINGNEIAFGTIGNASTSEGHFLEAINAAGVLQIPMVISIWDDGYGISVPQKFHTVKESISKALAGFQRTDEQAGIEILTARGWNYQELIAAYQQAEHLARTQHIPCLIHVEEMTQPQGHSTSGSHERYKSKERLNWEKEHDCNLKFRNWILEEGIATEEELAQIEREAKASARHGKEAAWKAYITEIKADHKTALDLIHKTLQANPNNRAVQLIHNDLHDIHNPLKMDIMKAVRSVLWELRSDLGIEKKNLLSWHEDKMHQYTEQYSSHVYSESDDAAIKKKEVKPVYSDTSKLVDGREVLQATFDHHLQSNPLVFALGEDVGKIGDVNQGFAGLQDKYGELRVTDTGIRETTIIGQGIGAALRGLRPIAEIQYLDYMLYALQTLS
ncbi:MAG: thiamine pyrophosphate-dependent enzyme, partial [Cyclobacteriaceae bacterium]|nr:thiamine pyrophosphate-dependent enzyme [Cyclobacteriaceae bacterium]